ncbi:Kinesin-Like Protein Kif9 [Manis pentadactyla]|nr:Kinesin-Like Protein Kif9 [Manis pentadactyla]
MMNEKSENLITEIMISCLDILRYKYRDKGFEWLFLQQTHQVLTAPSINANHPPAHCFSELGSLMLSMHQKSLTEQGLPSQTSKENSHSPVLLLFLPTDALTFALTTECRICTLPGGKTSAAPWCADDLEKKVRKEGVEIPSARGGAAQG